MASHVRRPPCDGDGTLVELNRKLDWDLDAECIDADTDFFSDDPDEIVEALDFCSTCPVRLECLTWALQEEEHHGVWGGLTAVELRNALSINEYGKYIGKDVPSFVCPNCSERTRRRAKESNTHDRITCSKCKFTWLTVKRKRRQRVDNRRRS